MGCIDTSDRPNDLAGLMVSGPGPQRQKQERTEQLMEITHD